MAVTVAQAVAKIEVQGDSEAKGKLSSMKGAVQETSTGFKGMLQNALNFAGGLGIFNLASSAMGFLKDQVTGVFQESMDAQAGMAQTEEVIRSTGGAAGMTAQQIADMAGNLSHLTTFSDDTIQSGENLLLTFTGIGKDVFPQATKTMLDMSQAMGQDVKSSAIQLGKALNDPAQGLTALTRVGVTFTDKQKEMIQQMVATGDTAGAQKIMLEELQREFGGSAEAAGKTFGGQLTILQQRLSDVKQSIGDALMPILQNLVSTVSSNVMPAIERFADFMSSPAFQKFASDVGQKILDVFSNIGTFIKNNIIPAFNDFVGVLKSPQFADFVNKLKDLGGTLGSVVGPAFTNSKPQVEGLFNFIKTTALPALSGLVGALTNTVKWLRDHGAAVQFAAIFITALYTPAIIKAGVEAVIAGVKTATSFVSNIVKVGVEGFQAAAKLANLVISFIQSGTEAAIAGGKIAVSFVANIVKSGVESAIAGAKVAASFVANIVKAGVEAVVAGAKIGASFVASMVTTGAQAVISGAKVIASFIASLISAAAEAIVSGATIMASIVPALIATAASALATAAPFILIGLVIAAVVIGIILVIQHWAQIAAWFQGVWTVVWGAVSTFFINIWNNIIKFLQNAWNFIVNAAKVGASLLLAMIIGPIGMLAIFIFQHWDQIKAATGNFINGVVNFFSQLPGRIMGFVSGIPGMIMGIWNRMVTDALNAGANIVKGIADGIRNAIHFVSDAINTVTSWISDHLPHSPAKRGPLKDLLYQGQQITEQVSTGMLNSMPKLNTAIGQLVKPISMNLSTSNVSTPALFPAMASSKQGGQAIHIHNYIDGKQITDNVMNRAIRGARTAGPIRSKLS